MKSSERGCQQEADIAAPGTAFVFHIFSPFLFPMRHGVNENKREPARRTLPEMHRFQESRAEQ